MIVTKGSNALTKIRSRLHDITIACNQKHRYPAPIHAGIARQGCGTNHIMPGTAAIMAF